MANDLLSTLRTYLTKVSEGEKSPAEIAAALNVWVRESGEALKSKIEEEVESSVSKMGFVKREEFDQLKRRMDDLTSDSAPKKAASKSAAKKSSTTAKKSPAKKSTAKKSVAKKSAATKARKNS
jgi:BMFP domain-containing protein YqiC